MNKTIWLIRHGESAANAGQASEAPDSIPLTEKGFEQARAFAMFFPETPSAIVYSPYLRAAETARPLIERFSAVEAEEWSIHEFTYLSRARCGNSTMAMRKPLVDEFWTRGDADYCDGGDAESFAAFVGRVQDTMEKLKTSEHKAIAVFTHGQFIRAVMWLFLTGTREINSKAMTEFYHFLLAVSFPNTGFIKLTFSGDDTSLSPILIDHLRSPLISY